jgi:site-specific recombinase XerD
MVHLCEEAYVTESAGGAAGLPLALPRLGRVEASAEPALPFVLLFPETPHEPASEFFRELIAGGFSAATVKSYAFDLLRFLRFLHEREVPWERVQRVDVRDFVLFMRTAPNPQRERRHGGSASAGGVNPVTGKPNVRPGYGPATINHSLSVLSRFYAFHATFGQWPIINPVPDQGGGRRERRHAHHNPMEPFVITRRSTYRQAMPRKLPRSMSDTLFEQLFGALKTNRDRALLSFYVSSGARPSELIGLHHRDVDVGRRTIRVVSKGTRLLEEIPASRDAFVWLALYLAEECLAGPDEPVWWTLRQPRRPLNYFAMRAVLERANAALGTNHTLHDLRHTAASRFASDEENFTLVDVQSILRHANLATTQLYVKPRLDELLDRLQEHYGRPRPKPTVDPAYDLEDLQELFGAPT